MYAHPDFHRELARQRQSELQHQASRRIRTSTVTRAADDAAAARKSLVARFGSTLRGVSAPLASLSKDS
jgi:hypothetical protein